MMCVFSVSAELDTCEYVAPESENSVVNEAVLVTDADRWLMKMGQHMIQDLDINTRVFGLSFLNFSYEDQLPTDIEVIDDILSTAIESPATSIDSLMLVNEICQERKEKQDNDVVCDLHEIKELLLTRAEQNMIVYFDDLGQAVVDRDEKLVDVILQQMIQTTYVDMNVMIPSAVKQVVSDFYKNDPPSQQAVTDFMVWLDIEETDIEANMNKTLVDELTYHSVLSHLKMSSFVVFPKIRSLLQACTEFQKQPDLCEGIAQKLVNNSSTFLMTLIGYNLMAEVQKVFADTDLINKSEAESDAYDTYRGCIIESIEFTDLDYDWHLNVLQTMNNMSHEGLAYEQIAMYVYQQKLNNDQKGAKDPRQCGLRYLKTK